MISKYYRALYNRFCLWNSENKDFKTNRHILVIESDDWGSIRMSSRNAWEKFLSMGYSVDKRPYERFDTLESNEDVQALADVLLKYKDKKGRHPVITLNYLSCNPDFDAIRKTGMSEYISESIVETYRNYPQSHDVINMVKYGISEGIFMPQCHGREHFNIQSWMKALQMGDEDTHRAFNYGMCGIAPKNNPSYGNHYMIALESRNAEQQNYICNAVKEGLEEFKKIWSFQSLSFVAPCYTWNDAIEKVLGRNNVRLIQSGRIQHLSNMKKDRYHFSGEKNCANQRYSVRNCTFEPATIKADQSVGNVLFQIEQSFENRKIAVISSHRINFVSGLSEKNRNNNLAKLDELLKSVIRFYPDVEFLSSPDLLKVF